MKKITKTIKNQIEKYSTLQVANVYLLEGGGMICCEAKKKISIIN